MGYAHRVAAPPARTGRKRSEASRQAILAAALDLLRECGYGGLTVDGLASRAGVGKQTIYRWWSSKAAVVFEALAEEVATISPHGPTGDREADVAAFLTAVFRSLRGAHSLGPAMRGLMAEAQLDPEFADAFRAFLAQRREALRVVIDPSASIEDARVATIIDMVFGAMWYRLLVDHAKLDAKFARALAREVAASVARCTSR